LTQQKLSDVAATLPRTPSRRWLVGLLLGCFVLACVRFALVQDIWIDESTQLSGVRLPLGELVGWLAGTHANRFGVPGDRMPPLAYLPDHLWWAAAGASVLRFRLFHILLATCGVAVVARTEIAALGRHWLGVGTAFLVLSPKMIEAAAELRCYPLFFTVASVLVALFLNIVQRRPEPVAWGKLLLFGAGCVVLSYIHFFGVVAAFAMFATLLLAFCTNRTSLLRVLTVGAGLALCLLGLYPFIFGATSISPAGPAATPGDITYYLPMLIGHPSLLIYPVAAVLYFGACALLLLAAAYGAARRARQRRTEPLDWLLAVALVGCAATIVPGLVISSFSALKPSYSIWLMPVFALLIALGAGQPIGLSTWDRYGRAGAAAAMLVGAAIATGVFLVQAPWFVHGPHQLIATARELSPPNTAILYAEPATYAYGYFPMVYQSGGHLPQWLAEPDGVARLTADGTAPPQPASALALYQGLVVVDIRARHYTDLRDCLNDRCPAFVTPPLVDQLVGSGAWSVSAQTRNFGFYDALVTRLTRRRS
jgi:hypothetical protein